MGRHTPESILRLKKIPERYRELDKLNADSWYMNGDEDGQRPFDVYTSVRSFGMPRLTEAQLSSVVEVPFEDRPVGLRGDLLAPRTLAAGNMSENWTDRTADTASIDPEVRSKEGRESANRFLASLAIEPGMTRSLRPQHRYDEPLVKVDVDALEHEAEKDSSTWLSKPGDFLYTHNPDIKLAVRPADCPIVFARADTPDGPVFTLTHIAWQGAASGFIDDMFERYEEIGVDPQTLRVYVTGGGQAESFPFSNKQHPHEKYPTKKGLFRDVTPRDTDDGFVYDYGVDTPRFVYDELIAHGLDAKQIFIDTSDTSRRDSGYSSHGRAARSDPNTPYYDGSINHEANGRDIIVAAWH